MSGSSSTTTTQALPQYGTAYSNLLSRAQQTGSQPYVPYTGQMVAGFNPTQEQVFGQVANTAGASGSAAADPYLAAAEQNFNAATTPLWGSVQQFSPGAVSQYESPYTQDVVNATQKQFDLQNAQQQQQLEGSAAAAGAFGGDRQAVMQAQLAGQQQAAQAPVIAGLENTGYQTALGEFNTQQQNQLGANEANAWLNSQAAFGNASLGSEAQNLQLAGESALANTGQEQQALAQENLNVPYEQWIAQQAYPYQQESWLAGMDTGLGGAAGSTSTTKTNESLGSSILGGLEAGAGLLGMTGAFPSPVAPGGSMQSGWLFKRGGGIGRGLPGIRGFAGGGIAVPGGGPDPENDNMASPPAATGTGGDYGFQDYAEPSWHASPGNAPWEALLQAGGETLASGNVGRGIEAGLHTYEGLRQQEEQDALERARYGNETAYRKANLDLGHQRLEATLKDAQDRLREEHDYRADLLDSRRQAEQDRASERQTALDIARTNSEAGRYTATPGIGVDPETGQQIPGAYVTNGKTGVSTFRPGMTLAARTPVTPQKMTPNEAYIQARKDYEYYRMQDSGYDPTTKQGGVVHNLDGSVADPTAWIRNRAARYLNGSATPAGAPAPAARQRPMPQVPPRPTGMDDTALQAQARAALQGGAPRAAVLSRLKAWGVSTDGL